MKLSGADILIRTLIEQGVDTVFGYPGGQVVDIYDSLYRFRDEITHILSAHEPGAVHAADGYARSTGGVGVVIATSGPGATNLVTGIATAYLDSVPLIAITGNVAGDQLGTDSFQEVDITGVTLPITKHNYIASSAEHLADIVREAFRLAKSGRPGPVLIDIPKDVQLAEAEYIPEAAVKTDPKRACEHIEEAVEAINLSNRPFVYFGGGVIASDAEKAVCDFAEKIDAPIGCSLMGISGVPTDHPRFLGMTGMHGRFAASTAMHHADCIIACGVRFNDRATGNKDKFARTAQVIHLDIDAAEFMKTVNASHCLKGDVGKTLALLTAAVEKKALPDWWEEIEKFKAREEASAPKREGFVPENIYGLINDYLQADTPVCTDVGQHQIWAAQYLRFKEKRRFISSGGLGTMGFGMGAAVGTAFATGKRTLLISGDGSFVMGMPELTTAVEHHLPIVILLIHNGVLGLVRQMQTMYFEKRYAGTVLPQNTDFVALVKAFGGDGCRVTCMDELKAALDSGFSDGVFLIDCLIDEDELVLPVLPPEGTADDLIVKVVD